QRLDEKYVSATGLPPASGNGPLCFMDIEVGGEAVGRLVFRLFADKTPKAAENFRALCTGEKGRGLRYEGSAFHRIIPGFVVQGGDFTRGDGRGGKSIYGDKFEDEPFMRHHKLGLLSMANKGANTNNSQFFITLKAVAHLDGKHVVFGEVESGIKVLDRMKSVTLLEPKRDGKPAPDQRVVISRCGQLKEDGTEVERAATPASVPPPTGGMFASSSPATPLASAAVFGRPSNLGTPSAVTTGSSFSLTGFGGAATIPVFGGAAASFGGAAASFGGGTVGGGSGGGGGGIFGSGPKTPAVPSFGQAGAAASPVAAQSESKRTGEEVAVKAKQSGAAAPSTSGGGGGGGGGSKDGFSTPPVHNRYFATPPRDLSAVAARVAALTPSSGRRRSGSSPRPHGGAAGAAFDRLDDAGTGWVGREEFEALVGSAGLPFETEKHGQALLKLCVPRLPRDRFLEWYAGARREQREAAGAAGAAGEAAVGSGGRPPRSRSGSGNSSSAVPAAGSPNAAAVDAAAVADQGGGGGAAGVVRETGSGGTSSDKEDDADADATDESGDEEERREERAKAEKAFTEVDSAAKGWMEESQFEALMEAVGTTYAVEDHKPKLLAICTAGRLERQAFLAWYMDWLFGDEESSDEEGGEGDENIPNAVGRAPKDAGFAALVKSQAGGWKCAACLVSNAEAALKCVSCEAVRPGQEGKVAASGVLGGAGILGGSGSGPMGGFAFGSPVPPVAKTATASSTAPASSSGGGFSFGAPSVVARATPSPAASLQPSAGTNAAGGFTFGAPVTAKSSASAPAAGTPTATIASVSKAEVELTESPNSANGDSDSDSDSGDEEERREERAKAEAAFDKVDTAAKGWVEECQFEALMEAVGTTYAVEDHKPKLLAICTDGRLERQAFLAWYMDWLFGDEESSDEEGEVKSSVTAEGSKDAGFAALVKSQAGGWKCAACLVSNAEAALKCASCETVRPGQEGKVVASSVVGGAGILGGSGSGPTGGFTFGSPVAPVAKTAAASAAVPAGSSGGGFSFGAPSPAPGATSSPAASLQPSAGTNAAGGFTFGAPVTAASAADTGAATPAIVSADKAEVAPTVVGNNSDDDSDGGGDSDSGDEGERKEEQAKAEAAFDKVDTAAKGWVEECQFEALMEAVGTTYAVEDHKPKLLAICTDGRLERQAFLMWYMDWLFGDEESSDEEGEVKSSVAAEGSKDAGFAALVKSQAGGWKCAACLVSNAEAALKCASCETVRPGQEGKVVASSVVGGAGILGGSGSGSMGGFTFGSPVAPVAKTAAASSTAPAGSSGGGFSFGAPSPAPGATSSPAASLQPSAGTNAAGGFTFGALVTAASAADTGAATPAIVSADKAEVAPTVVGNKADDDSDGGSDSDSGDEEERREERAKAEAAFDKVDNAAKGWVEENQFEALMEAVGTTYAVEDHKPKLLAICTDGRLERQAFLAWYMDWLFGEEESSDEEGEVQSSVPAEGSKDAGFAALVKSQAGGWKCAACLVSNAEAAVKCASCETAKPGEEGNVGAGILGGPSSGSAGGFTFGTPCNTAVATVTAGGFSFGVSPPAQTGAVPAEKPESKPCAGSGDTGGDSAGSAGLTSGSSTGGLTFGSLPGPAADEH
ncbi:unnamed protein product, partial [Ectocarpus sp. 8 AP-2014]